VVKRKPPTVEDVEEFCDTLQGPMGEMFQALYQVMSRRMAERGVCWEDLSSQAIVDQFHTALLEIAPATFPNADQAELQAAIDAVFANIELENAANSPSSDTVN